MNRATARIAARQFMDRFVRRNFNWITADLEGCLPKGWELHNVESTDLYPLTVEHVASIIQRYAREQPRC